MNKGQNRKIKIPWRMPLMVQSTRELAYKVNSILRRKECCDCVVSSLEQNISIPIQGKFLQTDFFKTLIPISVKYSSIHSINKCLNKVLCETSVWYHLKKLKIDVLEEIKSSNLSHYSNTILKRYLISICHRLYSRLLLWEDC